MASLILSVLIVVGLVSILIISQTGAETLTGKGYSDLSSEQKQKYWDCFKGKCKALLKEAQSLKNYTAYRDCSLNCNALAQSSSLVWCNDTDGGLDYFTKGAVFSNVYTSGKEDECKEFSNGKVYLKEGRCKNNKYSYQQKKCGELGSNFYCDFDLDVCKEKVPPIINAFLVYWGDFYGNDEVEDKINYFEEYFNKKTGGNVILKIDYGGNFALPEEDAVHDYSSIAKQFNLELEDAKNIWYYYHPSLVNNDIENVLKKSNYNNQVYDLAIIFTDINFQYAGQIYKYYPFLILKSSLYKNYETSSLKKEIISDAVLSDTSAHELGHFMGLTHACSMVPCSDCAYPNDIMSYCREKGSVNNEFFSCSISNIQSYIKLYPDGTMYPINKYFQLCDDLSSKSKCYGISCNNYCDKDKSYFLGGKCEYDTSICNYNYQLNSPYCKDECTQILTRTNIFNGVYSGVGIDDNNGWITVNLNSNTESMVPFGWESFTKKNYSSQFKLVGFTWEGYSIRINTQNNNELIIDPPGEKNVYKYKQSSANAENAIVNKESVNLYSSLEFVGGCDPQIDYCSNTNCEEDCNSLNGECVSYNLCEDFCNSSSNTWFYEGVFDINTYTCEYKKNKENICGEQYKVISRTNVINGLYNENGTTKDGKYPWIVLNQDDTMITLNYIETTFKLPWRTYTLVGYTVDNKSIEKEYYFGDYNKYIVDGKYLFENVDVESAITTLNINSEYINLEYHGDLNNLPNSCKGIICTDYCEVGTLNYNGFCNFQTGKCEYKQKESIICNPQCNIILSRTNKNDGNYKQYSGTSDEKLPWIALFNEYNNEELLPLGWTPSIAIASTDRTDYDLVGYTWDYKPIVITPINPTDYIINYEGRFTTTSSAKENAIVYSTQVLEFTVQEFKGLNCN